MKKIIVVLLLCSLFGCKINNKPRLIKLEGGVFGTVYHITYTGVDNYEKQIDSLFNLINKSLSKYLPSSDISKINKGDLNVKVDSMFLEVFQKSKRIHKETNGYFDPTVGNLVNAWGFGSGKRKINLDSLEVNRLMKYVGLNKVSIKDRKVVKRYPEMYLEFNSIAKGYGIDVLGRFLEANNVSDYLIEIGGEIRARGNSPKNKPWEIGIDDPNTDGSISYSRLITLKNKSMAGSGNYRKFRISKSGNKIVHTVNPKSGFATESNLLSAFVIAEKDCADVDAYATAFMAMGFDKAKVFLKKHSDIDAILIYVNKNGEVNQFSTDNE